MSQGFCIFFFDLIEVVGPKDCWKERVLIPKKKNRKKRKLKSIHTLRKDRNRKEKRTFSTYCLLIFQIYRENQKKK